MKLTPEQKQILSDIRHWNAEKKRHATHHGFIGYYDCMEVCDDLVSILDEAKKYMASGEFLLAYNIIGVILINAARLASTAGDSGGGVTFAKGEADYLLEDLCSQSALAENPEEAGAVLEQACKDALNKAFDG